MSPQPAFLTPAPSTRLLRTASPRHTLPSTSPPTALPTARISRRAALMCAPEEAPLSAAERTRRALSESEPLVKFRRDVEYLDEGAEFVYTKGVDKGVDVWLVTGVLTFLVPAVGFAVGVFTGAIDVSPR
eukprot:GFKZ01002589.1.p1 GENE.GFKZ01002589.1~~GFKZ01002589.1.p1  ORF type:complete len:130 (+),score=16.07 GFKZ01002589.1:198-587(+)